MLGLPRSRCTYVVGVLSSSKYGSRVEDRAPAEPILCGAPAEWEAESTAGTWDAVCRKHALELSVERRVRVIATGREIETAPIDDSARTWNAARRRAMESYYQKLMQGTYTYTAPGAPAYQSAMIQPPPAAKPKPAPIPPTVTKRQITFEDE